MKSILSPFSMSYCICLISIQSLNLTFNQSQTADFFILFFFKVSCILLLIVLAAIFTFFAMHKRRKKYLKNMAHQTNLDDLADNPNISSFSEVSLCLQSVQFSSLALLMQYSCLVGS